MHHNFFEVVPTTTNFSIVDSPILMIVMTRWHVPFLFAYVATRKLLMFWHYPSMHLVSPTVERTFHYLMKDTFHYVPNNMPSCIKSGHHLLLVSLYLLKLFSSINVMLTWWDAKRTDSQLLFWNRLMDGWKERKKQHIRGATVPNVPLPNGSQSHPTAGTLQQWWNCKWVRTLALLAAVWLQSASWANTVCFAHLLEDSRMHGLASNGTCSDAVMCSHHHWWAKEAAQEEQATLMPWEHWQWQQHSANC